MALPDLDDVGSTPSFLAEVGVTDIESLTALLKKHLPMLVLATLAGTALAATSAFRQIDVFAASAKIQLAAEPLDPTSARTTVFYDSSLPSDYVNTETYLLKSRMLSSIVIARRPELQKALAGYGDPVGAFEGSIYVRPIRETRLLEVGCEDSDPKRCATFANALAEVYCEFKQEERAKLTSGNVRAISEQLPKVAKRIEDSQREIDKYAKQENSFEHEKDLILDRLRAYNEGLNAAQRERVRADSEIEALDRIRTADRPLESAPSIAGSATIQRLRAELAQAEIELNQILEHYQEDCPLPKVRAAKSRRDDLRLQLSHEIETIRAGLLAYRDTKLSEEQGLQTIVGQLRDEARRLEQQAQRFIFLQKDIETNQHLYEELLRRSADLASYSQVEGSTIKIIDHAQVPGAPIRPNRPRTITLGLIVGLLAGLGFAYTIERLDSRLRSAQDVRSHLQQNVLALVPEVRGVSSPEVERLALTTPEAPFAEAFRRLRAHLHATSQAKVVLVTSGAASEGKTVSAINLALATANAGARVLIIDADMRRPSVHKPFRLDLEHGLAECLSDDSLDPEAYVRPTEVPNLFVLTAGHTPKNAGELLAANHVFARVIERLKRSFDRIVIDTPPAAFLSDAAVMAPQADAVVLIVSTRHSRRRATRLAQASLEAVGSRPKGVLLNHVSDRDLKGIYEEYYSRFNPESAPRPTVESVERAR